MSTGEDCSEGDNPFFIAAPPPGIAPEAKPEPAEAAESVAPYDLIDLPPGIVDSGTYKVPTPRAPKPDRLDDAPAFFPVGAPGLPPVVPVPAVTPDLPVNVVPSAAAPVTEPAPIIAAPFEAVDDATRASIGRRSAPAWRLALPDGREVLLERTTVVGRDPAAGAHWPDATLLPITDSGKSVSKTHAALELTAGGQLLVHDLDSTNGVYVLYPDSEETEVTPGAPTPLEPGVELSFGEFTVTITRG